MLEIYNDSVNDLLASGTAQAGESSNNAGATSGSSNILRRQSLPAAAQGAGAGGWQSVFANGASVRKSLGGASGAQRLEVRSDASGARVVGALLFKVPWQFCHRPALLDAEAKFLGLSQEIARCQHCT
jgi:hypothetical protein